jgi:hypothetical protein
VALSAALAMTACASLQTTPQQEQALAQWRGCQSRFPTATLDSISPEGKIAFSYKRPADLMGMNDCLEQAAARTAATPPTLAEPVSRPAPPPRPSVVPPAVAYSYRIVDDRTAGTTGNGDGRIQRGETVVLALLFKNVGQAPVERVSVDLAADSLALEPPRVEIGALRPSETKPGRVAVDVPAGFPASQLLVRVAVRAGEAVVLQDDLRLTVDAGPPRQIRAVSKSVVVADVSAQIRSGAGAEMPVIAVANPTQPLVVTGEVGDWYRLRLSDTDSGWVLKRDVKDPTHAHADTPTVRPPAVIGVFQHAPPVIALASPADGQQITADRVQLIGSVGSANGLEGIAITVNGRPVAMQGARGIAVKPASAASLDFSERIALVEGRNQIVVTATDAQHQSASRTVTVTRLAEHGQIHAVLIGISRYAAIRSLRYADRDAMALAEYLEKQVGVPRANITLLVNDQATLVNLKRVLGTELKRRAAEKDTVIIFYAGHGAPEADAANPDDDGLEKYLVPHDGDPRDLYTTGLPMREVENILQRLSAERVVVITDACYSGATGGRTFSTGSRRAVVSDNFLARLSRGRGRVVLTASRASEVSEERDELKHGVFTYYLLEGLRGGADLDGDGVITVDEIYAYVSRKVPTATGQNQHPLKKGEVEGQLILGRTR